MLSVIDVVAHEAQLEADAHEAHSFALASTVAEKVSAGHPLLEAVASVATSSGEPFDTVFSAVCGFVRKGASD